MHLKMMFFVIVNDDDLMTMSLALPAQLVLSCPGGANPFTVAYCSYYADFRA